MTALIKNPLHRALLILLAATAATFWMRSDDLVGLSIGISTIAIACFKGRLVILDFMELRHAPVIWRVLMEGWLLLVASLILLFYYLGITAS